jgi:hypothetical protein
MTTDFTSLSIAITDVLRKADHGRLSNGRSGPNPHFLTAYQILRRLPDDVRQALIEQYGEPGRGSGRHFTSVSRIAQVARDIADYDYMDAKELAFEYDDDEALVDGGNRVIGLYRAKR